ncbi:MAG: hypothetical protein ACYTG0_12140 [Planctomycetota bacterium]|jgi:hypothetical protein
MTEQGPKSWLVGLRRHGLGVQSAVLAGAVVVVYAVVAPVAVALGGVVSLAAAAVAAGLCLAGAELALVACRLFRGPQGALYGFLVGMFLRMGVPLVVALLLQFQAQALAEAGLLLYLVVFYPVTLGLETALSLPTDDAASLGSDTSGNTVS